MLLLARQHMLPVVVHSREADDDTVECSTMHREAWAGDVARIGVLHCCTGDRTLAGRLLDLGLYISFSGIVSFKNADILRDTARFVPDDRLLVETDSPFLAPEPYRGRKNEPMYVRRVLEVVRKSGASLLSDLRKQRRGTRNGYSD